MKYLIVLLCFLPLTVCADNWSFPAEVTREVTRFGEVRLILIMNSLKNQVYPDYELLIENKDMIITNLVNVGYQDVFASPENRYFLGVSNIGIPDTAYIIFDAGGNVIKHIKHHVSGLAYSKQTVTLIREWYDKKNPNVVFTITKGQLIAIHINNSSGERIELLSLPTIP